MIEIVAENISKFFNEKKVLHNISFKLALPSSFAITGKNGSGKSTLTKIIAGLLTPTLGSIKYFLDEKIISNDKFKNHIGFVSPYLNMYDEFSAIENLQILSKIRDGKCTNNNFKEILMLVDLWNQRDDAVLTYSSGMKQRLKYALALLHNPKILLLDEPFSNLDNDGVALVTDIIINHKTNGILVIATNNLEEAKMCTNQIKL